MSLNAKIKVIAAGLADAVLKALKDGSLDEILGASQGRAGAKAKGAPKAARKSSASGKISVDAIVGIVKRHPKGIRAEDLRKQLKAEKSIFSYYADKAVKEKRVKKTGMRRATTYHAR